jgi:hypothetical protein
MVAPSPRSVRFAADLCFYHEGAVLDMEHVKEDDVWYRMDELMSMKHQALHLSYDSTSINMGSILSSTYGRSNNDAIKAINAWVATCESLRGLERFANSDFGEKRANARRRTIQVVLTAQQKMRTDGEKNKDYIERVLSRLSEAFSQDYTRFAAILGHADMLVISPVDQMYCVNNSGNTDSDTIVQSKIIIPDMKRKNENVSFRSRNETRKAMVNRSSLCHRSRKDSSIIQRDFTDLRFCF